MRASFLFRKFFLVIYLHTRSGTFLSSYYQVKIVGNNILKGFKLGKKSDYIQQFDT